MKKVAVIGSGIAGLAIAVRLARLGFQVDVFERSSTPGGKVGELKYEGFRFDKGPSLFTLPNLVDELLDERFRFPYKKLETITRYFFEDGVTIDAYADSEKFAEELNSKLAVPKKMVSNYMQKAGSFYEITTPVFLFNSVHRFRDLMTVGNLKRLFLFPKLNAFSSMHDANMRAFDGNKYLVQLFDRYATYNGSNPFKAPGTLNVISHLEHTLGAFFPDGGMRIIVSALFEQAKELGVCFHFNNSVSSVVVKRNKLRGVVATSGFYASELIVSDVDIYKFYNYLLPSPNKLRKIQKAERSTSAIIFYWGMKKQFPKLDLHNIFFSNNYRHEFDQLFHEKDISDDPTVYVFISSKQNKEDAPTNCENWFVMVNAPENSGQDWFLQIEKTRAAILSKLRRMLGQNIEQSILFEEVLDPLQIEAQTGSFNGALYGPSSNSRFSAFCRHPNFHPEIEGLYFVGGSVHPGGGIPLCLSSAKIVEGLIKEKGL